MFDIEELTNDFNKALQKLDNQIIIKEVSKSKPNNPWHPRIKLEIFLTTSLLKMKLLGVELSELVNDKKFFSSMAVLRMLFEELILLTFVLSKLSKAKNLKQVDYVVSKVSTGRKTRKKPGCMPYNIISTMEEAEKYIGKEFKELVGMFENSYTFISDFVHPNAPSRFYFFKDLGDKIHFVFNYKAEDQDIGMVLNYSCMCLKMYIIIWERLKSLKFPDRFNYSATLNP